MTPLGVVLPREEFILSEMAAAVSRAVSDEEWLL
jgi:hypothetical protein